MIEIINTDRLDKEDIQVQYSIINLEKMLNKIQIDLIIKDRKDLNQFTLFFNNE